jgi:hypothetical protein
VRANLRDIVEMLKIEKSILQDGGYGRSVRTPWKENQLFRDSVICLNLGEEMARIPCRECLLWDFVPADHRTEEIPCHHIPLNDQGDTIRSLDLAGDRERAERALLEWLNKTIGQLEQRLAEEE